MMATKTQTIGWSGTILILLVIAGASLFTDDYRQLLDDNPGATYIMLDYAENERVEFITRGISDFLRWKYTEDKWTLYSGRYIGLEEDWLVYRQRTYLDLRKVADTSICSRTTATRCYVDDYFEPLDRKRTLVSLDYTDLDGSIQISKNTPYYAYPYASGSGGTLTQTALITDSSSFEQFPENYTIHFEPAMASNYQLVWRINAKPLAGTDYSNLGCSVNFKYNMKVNWCDELAFVEKAEWDDSRNQLRVYFNPTAGPQTYSVIAVDPWNLTGGCIAYWTFDDADISGATIIDVHNGSNNLTNVGSVTTGSIGIINEAVAPDGTAGYFTLASEINFTTGSYSMWIKPTAFDVSTLTFAYAGDSDMYSAILTNSTNIAVQSRTPGSVQNFIVPTMTIGSWHHVVVTVSSNSVRVYLNGTESSSGAQSIAGDFSTNQIGRYSSTSSYANGTFDEMGVWNRALNQTEISALYNNGTGLSYPFLNNPTYSSNSTNSTHAGTNIEHRLKWEDDTGLDGYIFSFDNGTGTFVNDSFVVMNGILNWSNVTKSVNSTAGATIQWCVYANDTSGNMNSTSCDNPFSYITIDITLPTYSSNSISKPYAGTNIEHRLKWEDDTGLDGYIFSFDNGTGTFVNDSFVVMNGILNWSNVTKSVNSTVGTTYAWCVYANDTSGNMNSTSCDSPFSYVTTIAPNFTLDGFYNTSVRYEFDEQANVTPNQKMCFNIAHPLYGYNYTCTNASFLVNLSNYLNLTPSENSLYNFMSVTNETNSTPFLDSFLEVIDWMFDILGTKSDFTISQFDNPLGTTIEINLSNTDTLNLSIWNQSNNDMGQIEFKVKSSGGTAITNLTIDMGGNNYTDYNTSSVGVWTTVEFNVSRWNNLTNITSPPSQIITIPFVFNADAGENISITDILFKREAVYYPKDLYIDIGNSSYNDLYLSGTISSSGSVDEFVEGFESGILIRGPPGGTSDLANTTSVYSVVKHIRLSPDAAVNQYIAGTPYWTAIGYKEYFDFRNESLINTSETTASLFTTSGVIISDGEGSKVQSISITKDNDFSHIKVRSQGEGIETQEGLEIAYEMDDGMNYTFFVSNDGGSNWINFTINETWTEFQNFSSANDTIVWKMNFNGTGSYAETDYGYLWGIELQTADTDWYNATIDFGNDGTIDWRESNSTNMTTAKTRENALNDYLTNNCTGAYCDVPLNFSWRGPGRYYYLFSEVIYNLTEINPSVNPLNFYLSNKNTSLTNITDFNGSATSSINTSQNAYLAIPREVIVHDFNLTITGASP